MTPPSSNVLSFTVDTSKNDHRPLVTAPWTKSYKNHWSPSRGHWSAELSTASKDEYFYEEPEPPAPQEKIPDPELHLPPLGADEWLKGQLGEESHCSWCANTLTLIYNQQRAGYQVHCSYCGASGPCENKAEPALDGFVSFTNQ